MKTTGIVRRIDDLGRIVIPKGIRQSLHITEGDTLEVFIDGDMVAFQKCDLNHISETSSSVEN